MPVAEGEAILDAALRAGIDLPFACKGGMCSTCRAKLVEGEAPMDINYSLEPWELKAGFVLTCQAKPSSERVVSAHSAVPRARVRGCDPMGRDAYSDRVSRTGSDAPLPRVQRRACARD